MAVGKFFLKFPFHLLFLSYADSICPIVGTVGFCTGNVQSIQNSSSPPAPCREACTLNFADGSCPFGNGSTAMPCGIYSCIDVYGGLRICNPHFDFPIQNLATSDALGCDNGPSWGQMKCTNTLQTYFRNDTCPWVQNITGWSSVTGLQQCSDFSLCSTISAGPSCCNGHGGKLRCPIDSPYMCAAANQCADGLDRCCLPSAQLCETAAMGGLRPCNVTYHRNLTSCALDGCTTGQGGAAAQTCANVSRLMAVFPAAGNSYQEALYSFGVDLKCLTCLRAGCGYCQARRCSNPYGSSPRLSRSIRASISLAPSTPSPSLPPSLPPTHSHSHSP